MKSIENLLLVAHQCTDRWAQEKMFEIATELRAELAAENTELRRRLDGVVKMLEPGEKPNCMDPEYNPSRRVSIYDVMRMWHEHRSSIHARACEIAGRTE